MRIKKIEIPIYYGYLVIVVSDNYQEVAKKYNLKENVDLYGAFVWVKKKEVGASEFLICIDENISNHLIAHEVVHLVNAIFLQTGCELDRQNDEPQAYLTGWVFQQIEKFLTKNN